MSESRENNSYEFDNILSLILNMYWSSILTKSATDIDGKHNDAMNLIALLKKSDLDESKEYRRLKEILTKIHRILKDEQTIKKIQSGEISKNTFLKQYSEEIFGDEKRKYNMRDLYCSDIIAKDKSTNPKFRLAYKTSSSKEEHFYKDSKGTIISIKHLGDLFYEEFNGVRSDIAKYKIKKGITPGEYEERIVYSRINISMMEKEEYRTAVLEELLSENNIRLSGCEGYIGEIKPIPMKDNDNQVSEEHIETYSYSYRVNNEYDLIYEAAPISAVINYSLLEKERKEKGEER